MSLLNPTIFTDSEFPPSVKSIYFTFNEEAFIDLVISNSDNLIWLRPPEIVAQSANYKEHALYSDLSGNSASIVLQGGLANCYLTAAISSLCHSNLNFILSTLLTVDSYLVNEGKLTVKLFYNAQWRVVTIDDYLPCNLSGNLIFAESEIYMTTCIMEFWVSFIEKAYAKLYGSYANLHGGNMSEALLDLTGCAVLDCVTPTNQTAADCKATLIGIVCDWNFLLHAYDQGNPICLGYCMGSDETKNRNGIITNHAYALIGLKHSSDFRLRYLKIRNTRGDVSFSSENPKLHAKNLATLLGTQNTSLADGDFWMSYEEFLIFFNRIYICRLSLKYHIAWFEGRIDVSAIKNDHDVGGCTNFWSWRYNPMFEICGNVGATVCLTLAQKDRRGSQSKLNYDQIGWTVILAARGEYFTTEIALGSNLVVKTSFVNRRNISVEFKIPKISGTQVCLAIPSTYFPNVEMDYFIFAQTDCPEVVVNRYMISASQLFKHTSRWSGVSSGGGPKYDTFINNPAFVLQLNDRPIESKTIKLDLILRQSPLDSTSKKTLPNSPQKSTTLTNKVISNCNNTQAHEKIRNGPPSNKKSTNSSLTSQKTSINKHIPPASVISHKPANNKVLSKTIPTNKQPESFKNKTNLPSNKCKVNNDTTDFAPFAIYVLRNWRSIFTKSYLCLPKESLLYETVFTNRNEIIQHITLDFAEPQNQSLLIVVCTLLPNIDRNFTLEIYGSNSAVDILTITQFDKKSLKGSNKPEDSDSTIPNPNEKNNPTSAKGIEPELFKKSHKTLKTLGNDYNLL